MQEYLFTLGIFIYMAGTVLSVLEEWPKQGLTDTSYLALGLWMSASGILLYTAYLQQYMTLSIVCVLSIIVTGYAIKLKLRDHRQYWKGLSLYALRMRGKK